MIELDVNTKNLLAFWADIRKEDLAELCFSFKEDVKEKFIEVCKGNKETYFLANDYGIPLAIGGVKKICFKDIKIGQVWFLCSNEFKKNKILVLRYVKNKLECFKDDYDFLFNFIYKSNFEFLKWLKKADFEIVDNNENLKLFYFSKGDINFDLRYITG